MSTKIEISWYLVTETYTPIKKIIGTNEFSPILQWIELYNWTWSHLGSFHLWAHTWASCSLVTWECNGKSTWAHEILNYGLYGVGGLIRNVFERTIYVIVNPFKNSATADAYNIVCSFLWKAKIGVIDLPSQIFVFSWNLMKATRLSYCC